MQHSEIEMSDHELREFANRVNQALDNIGFPRKHEGRQTELGRKLKADQKGVGRWLEGKGYPSTKNLEKLAKFLGVDIATLRYGHAPSANTKDISCNSVVNNDLLSESNVSAGRISTCIPLVPLYGVNLSLSLNTDDFPSVPSPLDDTDNLYASNVEGSSMNCPNDGYPHGTRIYWRMTANAATGDHVIAYLDSGHTVFRELDTDAGVPVLKPLNSQYSVISAGFTIVGVVVSRSQPVPNSLSV